MLHRSPILVFPASTSATVVIQPGETLTRSVRSDQYANPDGPSFQSGSVPYKPGKYRLIYSYDPGAHADFTISDPVIEQVSSFVIAQKKQEYDTGDYRDFVHGIRAVVLVEGEKRLILESLGDWQLDTRNSDEPAKKWAGVRNLCPYERLAEVSSPVTSLRITMNKADRLAVKWQTESGGESESEVKDEPKVRRALTN